MNRSHILMTVLGVLTIAAAFLFRRELRIAREAAFEEAKLARAHGRLEADVTAAVTFKAITAQRRIAAQEHLDGLKTSNPGANNGIVAFKTLGVFQRQTALDIQLQALQVRQFKARLPLEYGLFYRTAGLSPKQIQQFEDLLADHHGYQIDIRAATSAMGLNASDPEIVALGEADNDRLKADERELLGDAVYSQLEAFARTKEQRDLVNGLRESLLFSPSALSAEQISKLSALLAAADTGKKGNEENVEGWDFDKLRAGAAEFLSAPQLAQLSLQSEDRDARQITEQLIQDMHSWARATAPPGGAPASNDAR